MNRQFLIRVALAGVTSALAVSGARAEGDKRRVWSGNHGVNRVIRTTSNGHSAVSGHANISFSLPLDINPTIGDGTTRYGFNKTINPNDDKPSPYLGGVVVGNPTALIDPPDIGGVVTPPRPMLASQQVDAGIQFETGAFGPYPKGWAVAFSIQDSYLAVTSWDGHAPFDWRASGSGVVGPTAGRLITTGSYDGNMAFSAVPATGISLTVGGFGQIFWKQRLQPSDTGIDADATHPVGPYQADLRLLNRNQACANVKRAVAMTRRGATSELDGSSLSCTWSGCMVDGHSWSGGIVDQAMTGYDAPGNRQVDSMDRRLNHKSVSIGGQPLSKTIVEFPGPDNLRLREDIVNPGRYSGETVNINLGTVALPVLPAEVELQP